MRVPTSIFYHLGWFSDHFFPWQKQWYLPNKMGSCQGKNEELCSVHRICHNYNAVSATLACGPGSVLPCEVKKHWGPWQPYKTCYTQVHHNPTPDIRPKGLGHSFCWKDAKILLALGQHNFKVKKQSDIHPNQGGIALPLVRDMLIHCPRSQEGTSPKKIW